MAAEAGFFILFQVICLFHKYNTEYSSCRVSNRGTEYKETIAKSFSGADCLFWSAVRDLKGEDFVDNRFPDGSKRAAKNFCRNPSLEASGPWCYVLKNGLQKEVCNVPFCLFSDCRWTGPGEEYNGTISKTVGVKDCEDWSNTEYAEQINIICPNTSTSCTSCRNMNNAVSGPWCMLASDEQKLEKHMCDIPFCQLVPVIVNTATVSNTKPISTFHKINNVASSISLRVRLWDPNEWLAGYIGVLLSIFDLAASPEEIVKWHSGVFVVLANTQSIIAAKEILDSVETSGILGSMEWTNLTISWQRSSETFMVYVYINENRKPLLVADLKTNGTLLQKNDFQYFSIYGEKAFIDFATHGQCLTTTTSKRQKSLWFALERDFGQAAIQIFLKTYGTATVSFRGFFNDTDLLMINIGQSGRIWVEEISKGTVIVTSDVSVSPFDYQIWSQINITLIGDSLLITKILVDGFEVAANLTGVPRLLLWFGISSEEVSYWSLNCNPKNDASNVMNSDCSTGPLELDYKGFTNVAISGKSCTPWIDERIPSEHRDTKHFNQFGGRLNCVNYCRNLDSDALGAFCFVADQENNLEKQKCFIPSCEMDECKLSGTGTDFTGKLEKTRSGRTCRNHTLCRNPTNEIGGLWCYTDDPFVEKDLCWVQDCEWHSSEIILSTWKTTESFWYIMPHWKKSGLNFWIKNWNPSNDSILCVTITPLTGSQAFYLIIGGNSNEEISLHFVDNNTDIVLFQETTPRILKSGKWAGFWLRCGPGHIELGHYEKLIPFFEWESGPSEDQFKFLPVFYNFGTLSDFWIGMRFQPNECIVEKLSGNSSLLWPIALWTKSQNMNFIDFYVQGDGNFSIHFFHIPDDGVKMSVEIHYQEILILINESTVAKKEDLSKAFLNREKWVKITIRYEENFVGVEIGGENVVEITQKELVLLLYWFKVERTAGTLAWTANCEPLELGGDARDGGWSEWGPWTCDAPCGGGEGFRKRLCNNPRPNLLGKECSGKEIYRGPCNTFSCGDAPPDILKQIRKRLATTDTSLVIKKGSKAVFECNADLTAVLSENVPSLIIEWVLNGFLVTSNQSVVKKFSFELNTAHPSDSGVWVCLANWRVGDEDKSAVLSVTALIVISQYPTDIVRETSIFNLNCNGAVLGQIYAQLTFKWVLDGSVWYNYTSTLLDAVDIEVIRNVNESHSGVWMCIVTQNELGLEWTTSWINLQVNPVANFWSHLTQDKATGILFSGMSEQTAKIAFLAGFFFLIALPIVIILICHIMLKPTSKN